MCERIIIFSLTFLFHLLGQTWDNSGPYSGWVTSISVDKIDTNIVYCGTNGSGLFKSHNGGQTWNQINVGVPMRLDTVISSPINESWLMGDYNLITFIQVDLLDNQIIYAGTMGSGLIISEDGGQNWYTINQGLPQDATVSNLWIDPVANSQLLCGVDPPNGGLFKSINQGSSWVLVDDVPHDGTYFITSIVENPNNPEIVYVGFSSFSEPEPSWGLCKSLDRGNSWEIIFDAGPIYNINIDFESSNKMWGILEDGTLDWLLVYSEDNGVTWSQYPDNINPWLGIKGLYSDSEFNLYAITDNNENQILKSVDGGNTWDSLSITLPTRPLGYRLWFKPNMDVNFENTNSIYFGTRTGVYKSTDGCESVELMANGMINSYISDVAHWVEDSTVSYAVGNQGLWKLSSNEDKWIKVVDGSYNFVEINKVDPNIVYWGSSNLYRSLDGIETYNKIGQEIFGGISCIEIHPDSSNIIYLGVYPSTLYKTINHGDDWDLIWASQSETFRIKDIEFDPVDYRTMYFGAGDNFMHHGLFKSFDSGVSWQKISDPGKVITISTNPIVTNEVFIATQRDIMKSEDGGMTFQSIKDNLSTENISQVLFSESIVLLATHDQGIYYRFVNDLNWQSINGPYNPRVNEVISIPSENKLIIGTNGGGVWEASDIILFINDDENISNISEKNFTIVSVYPNPFNEKVFIEFNIYQSFNNYVNIYDINGKIIKSIRIHNENHNTNKVYWNGSDNLGHIVSSGIYFITILYQDKFVTRKVLFLK